MIQTVAGTCEPNWDYLGKLVWKIWMKEHNSHLGSSETDAIWDCQHSEIRSLYINMAKTVWDFAEKNQAEPLRKELEMLKNQPKITYIPSDDTFFMDMDGRVHRKSSK